MPSRPKARFSGLAAPTRRHARHRRTDLRRAFPAISLLLALSIWSSGCGDDGTATPLADAGVSADTTTDGGVADTGSPDTGAPVTDVNANDTQTDGGTVDVPNADTNATSDAPTADVPNTDVPNTDVPNTDTIQADTTNPDVIASDDASADTSGADATTTDAAGTDAASTDAANTDAASTDAASTDAASTDAASTDAVGADAAGTDAASTDAAGTDAASTDITGTATCKDQCGQRHAGDSCQCDAECVAKGDCCADWKPLCGCQADKDCDDGDACTTDACDLKTGVCTNATITCDDKNPCTADSCDPAKGCQTSPNSSACDDGDPCTQGDACADGKCGGVAKACDDKDPCTADSCDKKTGACVTKAAADGGACDDGDSCTAKDSCKAGTCAGSAVSCDDGNPCTTDTCDAKTGACAYLLVADGKSCSDGNACTSGDSCKAGKCSGKGKSCDDTNPCTVDTCDPKTSACSHTAAKDGAACSDFNPCTSADQCKKGVCAGTAKVCDDKDPCTIDACSKKDGACVTSAGKDGTACDDGDACTATSSCLKGACAGGKPISCDDGQACTKDSCDPKTGACKNVAILEGQPCVDGDTCTEKDSCTKGKCLGELKACSDGKPCTKDTCDAKTGACAHTALSDGAACSDGNACSQGDVCKSGTCVAGKDVCGPKQIWADGMACDSKSWSFDPDVKEPAVGWHLDATPATPKPKTTPASGGACTLNFNGGKDYDNGSKATRGTATSVKISVPTADYVELRFWSYGDVETNTKYDKRFVEISADGFQKTVQVIELDRSKDKKTWAELKVAASQWAGQQVQVRFRFESVDGYSNKTSGWFVDDVSLYAGSKPASCVGSCGGTSVTSGGGASCQCDPGCAKAGTCCGDFKAVCTGCKADKDCDDGSACTKDVCDSKTGACSNTAVSDGLTCDDGDLCTVKDTCAKGRCSGVARTCDDGNTCTWDSCDALKGCVNAAATSAVSCDDGQPCTVGDACAAGKCVGGGGKCDDKNPCTSDSCDAKTGKCAHAAEKDGASCSDGKACTGGDRCLSGACVSGLSKCNDGNPCTMDTCDAKTGKCGHTNHKDGVLCSDGQACTTGDVCTSGACKGKDSCTFSPIYSNKIDCGTTAEWQLSPANAEPKVGWHVDGTAAKPGYKSEKCSLNFNNGKDYDSGGDKEYGQATLIKKIALPSNGAARLTFASYHGVEKSTSYDHRYVQVSTDGFKTIGLNVKLNNAKDVGVWSTVTVDLSAFAGKSVQVRFVFDSVDDYNNSGLGWFVDDLTVELAKLDKVSCTGDAACHDGDDCTVDKCVTGSCVWTTAKDGAPCGDGDVCLTGGACKSGTCNGTKVVVCNDGKPCTVDSCDPAKGCLFSPAANGASCDDGDLCTSKDTCNAGSCKGAAACDDGNSCTVDTCDAKTGKCTSKLASDGQTCSDGNPCTEKDACAKGTCAAKAKDCDDGNTCTVDSCDQKNGKCVHTAAKDGASCSDGNSCSIADVCKAGTCSGKDVCTYKKLIDDSFPCDKNDGWTFAPDAKEPAVAWHIDGTVNTVKPKSGACSLNYNNGKDFDTGKKVIGAATSKTVSLPQSGNARLRFWSYHGVEKSDAYDKRTVLVSSDGFKNNVTVTTLSNSKDKASDWTAHEVSLNAYLGKKVQVRFAFDSVDAINNKTAGWFVDDVVLEVGSGAAALSCGGRCGQVVQGAKCQCNAKCVAAGDCCQDYKALCTGCADDKGCDDGNPCTVDTCDTQTGQCKNTAAKDGAACDDGSLCMVGGACSGGVCSGKTKTCSDGKLCTFDTCKAGVGCVFPNNNVACNDNNPCTEKDACSNGKCGGVTVTCDDKNSCTNDSCDAKKSGCTFTAKADGAFCSDGQLCTTPDTCTGGKCSGKAKNCDDGAACTVDACDAKTGSCTHKAVADGTSCNDGDACTLTSACKAGACVGVDVCQSKTVFTDSFACGTSGYWSFTKAAVSGDPVFAIDNTPVVPKVQTCTLNFNNGKDFQAAKGGRVQGAATSSLLAVPAAAGAQLSFLSYHDTETSSVYDNRYVEISDDGFIARVQQVRLDNKGVKVWSTQLVDLGRWLGRSVRVRFRFDSKDGVSNNGAGWFVDNVTVVARDTLKACKTAAECGDGGPCATAACTKGSCVFTASAKDGAACDDGNPCTQGDQCTKGQCGGKGKVCDDKDPCTWDACSPETGACTAIAASDNTPCGGGNVCAAGKCVKP